MMLARINKLPYIGTPRGRVLHSHEVFTTVSAPEPDIKPDTVPLWVVILSAVAGAIILLLLIFMLYKVSKFTVLIKQIIYEEGSEKCVMFLVGMFTTFSIIELD